MKKFFLRHLIAALCIISAAVASAATPKYIFYFIGDGMGLAPVMATQTYNRMVKNNPQALRMMSFPYITWAQTYSASSPVTDSAAAGTALSTGSKTRNGMLGQDADTVNVTSIARQLKDLGYGIGLVTNGSPDDATPAAFYAHVPNRGMFVEIAKQAAASGYDFIAGGGWRGLKKENNGIYEEFEKQGVVTFHGMDGVRRLAESDAERVVLLNPDGYADPNEMGFIVDSVGADGVGITLPTLMQSCLAHLQKNSPSKFFMMVEESLIDHALHSNDGGAAVREVQNLDDCVEIAYQFYLKHPEETLIIITADHDTGGMSVGCRATGYNAYLANIDAQTLSKGKFSDYCAYLLKEGKTITWEQMKAVLEAKLGFWKAVKLRDSQTEALKKAFDDTFVKHEGKDEKGLYKTSNAFASEVFRVFNDAAGLGFTTPNHTGNPVPVFAIGAGAENFTHQVNNIEIPQIIRRLTNIPN